MLQKTNIRQKDESIAEGFYAQLTCCACGASQIFVAAEKKDLIDVITEEGWRNVESDSLTGHHCGCKPAANVRN